MERYEIKMESREEYEGNIMKKWDQLWRKIGVYVRVHVFVCIYTCLSMYACMYTHLYVCVGESSGYHCHCYCHTYYNNYNNRYMYAPRRDMGDLNTMHEATMITTLFNVLATLWVTGPDKGKDKKRRNKMWGVV